jgi:hypothetical protein
VNEIFQGVGVLLGPTKKKFEWGDPKKMTNSRTVSFLLTLYTVDKDTMTNDQLARLTTIFSKDECQVGRVDSIKYHLHVVIYVYGLEQWPLMQIFVDNRLNNKLNN